MNSKILSKEIVESVGNGLTLYYGAKDFNACDVISITVKGKFKPSVMRTDNHVFANSAKNKFILNASNYMNDIANSNKIGKHYILLPEITERGLTEEKSCKLKYTLYVKPKNIGNMDSHKGLIHEITNNLDSILIDALESNSFEMEM